MTALGVSLLIVGAIIVVFEAHVPAYGMLGGPGVAAVALGAVLAVSGLGGGIVLGVVLALLLAGAGFGLLAISVQKGAAVKRRRIRSGPEGLIGHIGEVRSWERGTGRVLVDGALWRARRSLIEDGDGELSAGDSIVVERLTGLTLCVRRAEDWELVP
jgi:membrane-bound serine protease (ClpP class)